MRGETCDLAAKASSLPVVFSGSGCGLLTLVSDPGSKNVSPMVPGM